MPIYLSGVPQTLTVRRSSMGVAPGTSAEALVRLPTTNATKYDDMGGVSSKLRRERPPAGAELEAEPDALSWRVLNSVVRCSGAVRLKL